MSSQDDMRNVILVNDKINAVLGLLGHVDSTLILMSDNPTSGAYWVELLGHLHRIDQTVQSAIGTAINGARHDGLRSWSEVGDALEVTKQGAQQRWG